MKSIIIALLAVFFMTSSYAEDDFELDCLTKAIYHEARGESLQGQIAVGWVIINRTLSSRFPDTICDVIYQRSQFSWTIKPPKIRETYAYELAKDVAHAIINRVHPDPTKGALYFNSLGLYPGGGSRLTLKINQHYFYK